MVSLPQAMTEYCTLDILCGGFQYEPALAGTAWAQPRAIMKTAGFQGFNLSLGGNPGPDFQLANIPNVEESAASRSRAFVTSTYSAENSKS